jgi:hypothetical protein
MFGVVNTKNLTVGYFVPMAQLFVTDCIDKMTGKSFPLHLAGATQESARYRASLVGFVTGPLEPTRRHPLPSDSPRRSLRPGGPVFPALPLFDPSFAHPDAMVKLLGFDAHPYDRHFLLMHLAEGYYKLRDKRLDALEQCEWVCWQWFVEIRDIMRALRVGFAGDDLSLGIPKRLILVLEKAGQIARARHVAELSQWIVWRDDEVEWLVGKAAALDKKLAKGQ